MLLMKYCLVYIREVRERILDYLKNKTYHFMYELLKVIFNFLRLLGSLCLESNHGTKKIVNKTSVYTDTKSQHLLGV